MHPRLSVNAVCTPDQTLEEDLALWQSMGLTWAGLHRRKLDAAGDWATSSARIAETGIQVSTVVHSDMYALDRPDSWAQSTETVVRVLEGAARLGARCVYGTTGTSGRLTWEQAAAAMGRAGAEAVERARRLDVPLGIEPTNPLVPHSFVHTLRDVTDLALETGLRICVDTFWCSRERALRATLQRAMPLICHFQVADVARDATSITERAVPGEGQADLERLLGWALDLGYEGPFEVEVTGPHAAREGHREATLRSAEWLARTLERLGA